MTCRSWSTEEAERRFGQLLAAARRKPQTITQQGKPVAVVVAAEEYERLRALQRFNAPSFAEMLLAMPQGGIEFERLDATVRDRRILIGAR
jgi:prevent-host-death family protein